MYLPLAYLQDIGGRRLQMEPQNASRILSPLLNCGNDVLWVVQQAQVLKLNINQCLSTDDHKDILSHQLLEAVYVFVAYMKWLVSISIPNL